MGVENCDLQGLFLLNDLRKLSKSEINWLHRNDRLMVTNRSNYEQERISINLKSIFEEHGFDITIENVFFFQTDFLEVKINLRDIYKNHLKSKMLKLST